jgi:HlyD family secretion protein
MKKVLIIGLILVIAGASVWYFFLRDGNGEENPFEITQRTAVAFKGDLVVSIHSNGTVEPVQTVEVKSKASGEILKMAVDVGDYVYRDSLICLLDTTTAYNDYRQAEADYKVALVSVKQKERDFERQKQLYDKNLLSEKELDIAELALEQAKATLVRATSTLSTSKERLEDTEIRSPMNGLVLQKAVEEGQIISSGVTNVSGGTTIVRVARMDSVYVVADVDETDIGQVDLGQRVQVEADAFPDMKFRGVVEKISPLAKVEQSITVFEVTTKIDNSTDLLKAGMNCTIEVVTAEAYDAVLVPNDAVKDPEDVGLTGEVAMGEQKIPTEGKRPSREEIMEKVKDMTPDERQEFRKKMMERRKAMADKKVVMVKRNGEYEPQMVSVGESNLDNTEIISGLEVGDTVDATPVSLMMQQRKEMRERIQRYRGNMGGLKKTD